MSEYKQITLGAFGENFIDQVFNEMRLKTELDKVLVRETDIRHDPVEGTINIQPCWLSRLHDQGNVNFDRAFDMTIPFHMSIRVTMPLFGQEKYEIDGMVRMRLWIRTYAPLYVYISANPLQISDVTLMVKGDGNWFNSDLAKNWGHLEDKLKDALAKQFNEEFEKAKDARMIDILKRV